MGLNPSEPFGNAEALHEDRHNRLYDSSLPIAALKNVARKAPDSVPYAPYDASRKGILATALDLASKRLDGQLAVKTATEARATGLAGNCITVSSALSAGLLYELNSGHKPELIVAAAVALIFFLMAVTLTFYIIVPRMITLPGRLPSDMWDEVSDSDMSSEQFTAYMLAGMQRPMVQNEKIQGRRGLALQAALGMALMAIPGALISAAATYFIPDISSLIEKLFF